MQMSVCALSTCEIFLPDSFKVYEVLAHDSLPLLPHPLAIADEELAISTARESSVSSVPTSSVIF